VKPHILLLTAGFGEGHNAAARALAAALDREAGSGTADIADVFALASPRFNRVSRNIYLTLINNAPQVWSHVYDRIDRTRFVERRLWLFRREIRTLAGLLATKPPTAICCTYPLYAFFLEKIARDRTAAVPIFNVVTDSISIHSLWWRAACDGWFLPNEDSAAVVRTAGIPTNAIHVSGFPVPAFFGRHAHELSPPDLAGGAVPRVLHIINSGTRHAADIARHLLRDTAWEVTCAVGRDVRLRRELERLAASRLQRTTILGWTDQIPRLLMTHHAVVSKAGGATTQEAIAALCPMIVNQVVPGQEEGNYELLRRHGIGARAETPEAVVAALQRAFAHHGRLWREWRAALRPLARVTAADDIARLILARTSSTTPAFEPCHVIRDTSLERAAPPQEGVGP
jgi:processive 1,2-diacylglycerol beta-glucosyltransferase